MPVISDSDKPSTHRLAQAGLALAGLMLLLAVATCALAATSLRLGVVQPPAFSVRVGTVELAAPCPQAFSCDVNQPYYAIWRGDPQPDGSVKFSELYFVWLKGRRP